MNREVEQILRKRYNRQAQQKHRGVARLSANDRLENVLILLAWEAGELSEGQVVAALGADRLQQRSDRIDAIKLGAELGRALWRQNRPKP